MGAETGAVPFALRRQYLSRPFGLRSGGSRLLRKFLYRSGLWHVVAALFCWRGMGPLRGWGLGLLSRRGFYLGIGLSLGLGAVSLWKLGIFGRLRLGLAARRGLEQLVYTTHLGERS